MNKSMNNNLMKGFPTAETTRKKLLDAIFSEVYDLLDKACSRGHRTIVIQVTDLNGKGRTICRYLVENLDYVEEELGYEVGVYYPSDEMFFDGIWVDEIEGVSLSW